jgi:hypothetical protein
MIFLLSMLRFTPYLRHIRRFRPWNYSRSDCFIRLPWKSALNLSIISESRVVMFEMTIALSPGSPGIDSHPH